MNEQSFNPELAVDVAAVSKWSGSFEIILPEDFLSASIIFHVPQDVLNTLDREQLKKTVILKLRQSRVSYGIDASILEGYLASETPYYVAKARLPIDGRDSEITLIELPELKPEVMQDGSANFYNINTIPPVAKDDWLGEKKPPVPGVAGINVKGLTMAPKEGKDFILLYDQESVIESEENGLTVIRALRDGMVHIQDDRISVLNHYDFENIDFSTGSINFDGSITISGSIVDGFSVQATGDISILGDMGVGAVAEICSREGSIFIKGGIAGGGKAIVRAARDIYTKYALDATLEAGGKVSIGFFCRNSNIRAEEVIVESSRGRIQGGRVEAVTLITASEAGSEMEARTELVLLGFQRTEIVERLEEYRSAWLDHKRQLDANRANLTSIGLRKDLDPATVKRLLPAIRSRMAESLVAMKGLEKQMKDLQRYLRMKNEGELHIAKINPNCCLFHNGLGYEIRERRVGVMFYCNAGLLMEK